MMKIWSEIGSLWKTEQRLAAQTTVINTNSWLSKVELHEIERKSNEGDNKIEQRT